MPTQTLFESGNDSEQEGRQGPSIVSGIVQANCDLPLHGKVLVRVPSTGQEVLARVAATGAGSSRGYMNIPQRGDEVLVALNNGDPEDGFIVGNLWNTTDRPPTAVPTDVLTKRIIKTGVAPGVGHEVEFDDALQSITITSSTEQKITIDPAKIEIATTGGTAKITMDVAGNISIQGALSIEMKAPQIKLEGANVEINGKVKADLKSDGICNVNAKMVKIN